MGAGREAMGGQQRQRPLGDRDLAERRRVDAVGHHLVARSEVAQVEHRSARGLGSAHDRLVERANLGLARRADGRARPAR